MRVLRRVLSYPVSVEAMIEILIWLAIPYLAIGLGWAFFHAEQVRVIETQLQTRIPAGSDLVGFGLTAVLWPLMLFGGQVCAAS
ncbi:MAG TPA: hypothetical protein VFB19_09605 [Mycobacterium sp.]|nr:hypothetical protein [Mycobacterium sp.]